MRRNRAMRLAVIGGAALALSACMMEDYGGGYGYPAPEYAPAPVPAYTAEDVLDPYAYIDRADSLWEAIGDAPPDHSFAFEGAEPWAWQTDAGYWIVVEDGRDGIRSYYFEPGERTPFLTVEPGHSFGFEGDRVAVVYGPDGGALPRAEGEAWLEDAVALFVRGRRMRAALDRGQWEPVDTQAWIDTSPLLFTTMIDVWDTGPTRYPEWHRHRERTRASDWRHRIEAERLRRRDLSDAFRRWREGGFQGPPPGRWRRPGEARPDRPHRPGTPHRPGIGTPPGPATPPGAGTPPRPGTGRPDRPRRPEWNRPGRPRPRPGAPAEAPAPGAVTPTPDAAAPPVATPPATGERPRRPGWSGWRPQPGTPGATPTQPRPRWTPGWRGNSAPRMTPPAPDGAPSARPERPRFTRPAPQPGATPAPQRPRVTPPVRSEPRPAPRQGPVRPAKLPSDDGGKID